VRQAKVREVTLAQSPPRHRRSLPDRRKLTCNLGAKQGGAKGLGPETHRCFHGGWGTAANDALGSCHLV